MHAPEVLFLDEPSIGLDPAARLFVWDRLRELRDRGVTLVLTTHDMDEAAALADRVGIMDRGTLLALDTPEALMRSVPSGTTIELTTRVRDGQTGDRIVAALGALPAVELAETVAASPDGGDPDGVGGNGRLRIRLYVDGDGPMLVAPAAAVLAEHGSALADVKLGAPSLEDVFIHLTGRTLR
jgi:ABC-2 type transport system ATP-binding protein